MKRYVLYSLLVFFYSSAFAVQKITFMPFWLEQTQWAGYYIAQEKGFYDSVGLSVTFVHPAINSTRTIFEEVKSGNVQIITSHLPEALVAYDQGVKLVNVLQTSQNSSLLCVSRDPLKSVKDLDGLKIARWKTGNGLLFDIIANKYHLGITWIPFIRGVNLYVYEAVDAILCYGYNEYYTLLSSVGSIRDACIISAAELGFNIPEDGIYVDADYYKKHKDAVDKFVSASKKGWEYARAHTDEALSLTRDILEKKKIPYNTYVQKQMLNKVLSLQINPSTNEVDYSPISKSDFDKTVNGLLDCGIISRFINYSDVIINR